MRLTCIGHACFLVEGDAGPRILLDPYQPGAFQGRMGLRAFTEPVDVVVSTHDHLDHFHLDPAFGNPDVVRATATARGIEFRGVKLPHDEVEGAKRGFVTGFRFAIDGVSIVHPGDLGRVPRPEEAQALAPVDVLLLPVGGTFTVGPEEAARTVEALRPRVVVPMHYLWPTVKLALQPIDDFLAVVRRRGWPIQDAASPLAFAKDALPEGPRVVILPPTH